MLQIMVKILFFGILAEKTGLKEAEAEGNKTLREILEILLEEFPDLQKQSFKISVDRVLIQDESMYIHHHSEIALLPPFSGG